MLLFQYIYMINKNLLNFHYKIVQNLTRIDGLTGQKNLIRDFGNKLGLAWWAKIETDQFYWSFKPLILVKFYTILQ